MKTEIVTNLKRQATRILADLHAGKEPILITEQGKPSAYLVDVDLYELNEERMRILEGIARGERAIVEKRVVSHAEAEKKLKKWLDLIWAEPALSDLDDIAAYIALDNLDAAKRLVRRVFASLERLKRFPESGRVPPELHGMRIREVIVGPCRIFYRAEKTKVFLLYVMRGERQLQQYILEERAPK